MALCYYVGATAGGLPISLQSFIFTYKSVLHPGPVDLKTNRPPFITTLFLCLGSLLHTLSFFFPFSLTISPS